MRRARVVLPCLLISTGTLPVLRPAPANVARPSQMWALTLSTPSVGTRAPSLSECLQAARTAWATARRQIPQSSLRNTLNDTVGFGARRSAARACGVHFHLAGTPAHDRVELLELALFEQHDSLGEAVLAGLLSSTASPTDTGALTVAARELYPRFAQQEQYMLKVATSGSHTDWTYFHQLAFHVMLLEALSALAQPGEPYPASLDTRPPASVSPNEALLHTEIEQVLQLTAAMRNRIDSTRYDSASFFAEWQALSKRFYQLARQHADSATVFAHAARARQDMSRYAYSPETHPAGPHRVNHWYDWSTFSLLDVMRHEMAPAELVNRFKP